MVEVANLEALRNVSISGMSNGDIIYVLGHSTAGDGGGGIFMWRTGGVFVNSQLYDIDNNGTVVRSNGGSDIGKWVRQYDGYINVLYFGAFGKTADYTDAFQNAINFAALNFLNDPELKGSVVYVPNGNYRIDTLLLKHGISVLGESIEGTFLQTTNNHTADYMFEIESGPVFLNMANLKIYGRNETDAGCFLFEAKPLPGPNHGGLWNSSFKNIQISGFRGHGIYLKGGVSGMLPNQFNTFENVRAGKNTDFSNSLKMTGQNGQHTFLNCTFDGFRRDNNIYPMGHNVNIAYELENNQFATTGILSFINCTFQEGDYGIYMNYAENINIDGCWFEDLGVAITINGQEFNSCRDITVQNSRFANAAGYGSRPAGPANIKAGQCISITNSFVNVYNNYVSVSDLNSPNLNPGSAFIFAHNPQGGGTAVSDNVFQDNKLNRTAGIMQVLNVSSNTLQSSRHKIIYVNTSTNVIKSIVSSINSSETITIRANEGSIKFDSTRNINLIGQNTLTLNRGEVAVFMKIDIAMGAYPETYHLISLIRQGSVV